MKQGVLPVVYVVDGEQLISIAFESAGGGAGHRGEAGLARVGHRDVDRLVGVKIKDPGTI